MHEELSSDPAPSLRPGTRITRAGELNALINKRVYRDADKRRMLHLLKKHQLLAARQNNALFER